MLYLLYLLYLISKRISLKFGLKLQWQKEIKEMLKNLAKYLLLNEFVYFYIPRKSM